ncbi:MAG TPA: hypothetical protein VHO72_12560 [Bacteroidales bacterium]|nr:hypothetical protein [Bacteroidales bacterium]
MNFTTLIVALLFFWTGFVCAISFMEAWLKFRVKGVTLAIGLSIGKKVFTALNLMEWAFLLLYAALFVSVRSYRFEVLTYLFVSILLILVMQTFFLLPRLNKRVHLIVEGTSVEKSFLHVYYVSLELLKVILLTILGFYWMANL